MIPLIKLKKVKPLFVVSVVFAWFAVSPQARAVCQEGCDIPNGNTFLGDDALISNTTGGENTATGDAALAANTTGSANTAMGAFALRFNTMGDGNTATGFTALQNNTTGDFNTANGEDALFANTTGSSNTASGASALITNITGDNNTATGATALFNNATGSNNTATGSAALSANATGDNNTANGTGSLASNTIGSSNIAVGHGAGSSLTMGDNNIDIGNEGVAGEANTIRVGTQGTQTATFIAGVSGAGVMGPAVKVNAAGQIGTAPSSLRFKQNVKSMGDTSDALFALRPVTFRYKQEIDPEGIQQFGLVAEEVDKIDPNLVIRDADGKPYTVRYEAVDAMLLNEFLQEHRIVQEQSCKIHELEGTVAELKSVLRQQHTEMQALASGLEKVSAELQLSRSAQHTVAENP